MAKDSGRWPSLKDLSPLQRVGIGVAFGSAAVPLLAGCTSTPDRGVATLPATPGTSSSAAPTLSGGPDGPFPSRPALSEAPSSSTRPSPLPYDWTFVAMCKPGEIGNATPIVIPDYPPSRYGGHRLTFHVGDNTAVVDPKTDNLIVNGSSKEVRTNNFALGSNTTYRLTEQGKPSAQPVTVVEIICGPTNTNTSSIISS